MWPPLSAAAARLVMAIRLAALSCLVSLVMIASCRDASGTKALTDCDYSEKVQTIIDTFHRNVGIAVAELTRETAAATERDDAVKAITALDRELGTAIARVNKLNVTGEIKVVNDELAAGLTDFKNRLPEARRAAESGDFTRIETILDEAAGAFGTRFEGIDQRHPSASARLAKCQ